MFLLFHLERPDVISGGDLGIRKAIQVEYGLDEMPTPQEVVEMERGLAAASQPRLAVPVGVAGRGPGRLTVVRRSFYLGLVAVALVAVGSVLAALLVRSHEVDHFHALQEDEALRSARQAEAVADLSVGELATAAAFFRAEERFSRHEFEVVGNSLLRRGALTAYRLPPVRSRLGTGRATNAATASRSSTAGRSGRARPPRARPTSRSPTRSPSSRRNRRSASTSATTPNAAPTCGARSTPASRRRRR